MSATPSSPVSTLQFRLAALLALLAVGLGAMGAHAFKSALEASATGVENWKTAALYHLVHAVALVFLAGRGRTAAWWLLFAGVILFSGSLYVYCLSQIKAFAIATPIGGVLMMAGWAILIFKPLPPRA